MSLLQELLTAETERRPEAPAIISADGVLSFEELEHRTNQLARMLREHGCRRGDRVCVLAPRSAAAIISMIGTYKADAIYVPIDPAAHAGRVAGIVEACRPACVLTTRLSAERVEALHQDRVLERTIPVGSLERHPIAGLSFATQFSMSDVAQASERPVAYRNRAANPAYVVFSQDGDIAKPRGTVCTHASVRRLVVWANDYFQVRPTDRHALSSPMSGDGSILESIAGLAAGASVCPVPEELDRVPHGLAAFIRRVSLTQWCSSLATLSAFAEADVVAPGDFPELRHVIWRGAVAPPQTIRYWTTRLGHARFTALYGFSETTIASAYYTLPRGPSSNESRLPVGTPCPGADVLLLTDSLDPVGVGETGEIWVRGLGVSPGYWRQPDATRGVFRQGPRGSERTGRIYRTGDLARREPDGSLYVVARRELGPNSEAAAITTEDGSNLVARS